MERSAVWISGNHDLDLQLCGLFQGHIRFNCDTGIYRTHTHTKKKNNNNNK